MMKSMVVYSSKTGNTRKVAEAIYAVLPEPKEIYPVEEAPPADAYDFLALGFWVDKGRADAKAEGYISAVKGKKIGLFGTLGAYPDSDHARASMENAVQLTTGNELMGTFLCQGRVDPALVKWMAENMKDDPNHAMTPERRARLAEGERHPDESDLSDARKAFKKMSDKLV
jgi:flavodoxin